MAHTHNCGSAVRIFLNFALMTVIIFLYQKNVVQDKWAISGPKIAHPYSSGSALRMLKYYRMKGAGRYMKILLLVFREEHSTGAI